MVPLASILRCRTASARSCRHLFVRYGGWQTFLDVFQFQLLRCSICELRLTDEPCGPSHKAEAQTGSEHRCKATFHTHTGHPQNEVTSSSNACHSFSGMARGWISIKSALYEKAQAPESGVQALGSSGQRHTPPTSQSSTTWKYQTEIPALQQLICRTMGGACMRMGFSHIMATGLIDNRHRLHTTAFQLAFTVRNGCAQLSHASSTGAAAPARGSASSEA